MAPRFVEEVKKQCADMDAQWDERQKTRAEETEAISKVRAVRGRVVVKLEIFSVLQQQKDENWGWNLEEQDV